MPTRASVPSVTKSISFIEKRVGNSDLVGLELAPGGPDGGVLVGRVLDLDDREGQAVDEQDDIGPAGALRFSVTVN